MRNKTRKPTSPGEMLNAEFLKPLGLTQSKFADHIGESPAAVSRIVNGRKRLTPKLAAKFAAAFEMSVEFWLRLQVQLDVWTIQSRRLKLPKPLIRS